MLQKAQIATSISSYLLARFWIGQRGYPWSILDQTLSAKRRKVRKIASVVENAFQLGKAYLMWYVEHVKFAFWLHDGTVGAGPGVAARI